MIFNKFLDLIDSLPYETVDFYGALWVFGCLWGKW